MRRILFLLFSILLLSLGCTDDNPSAPEETSNYFITISNPATLSAPAGVVRTLDISVKVRDIFGNPVPSLPVNIGVSGNSDDLEVDATTTDGDGIVSAHLSITMPALEKEYTFSASAGDQQTTSRLKLIPTPAPANLYLNLSTNEVRFNSGEMGTIEGEVRIVDATGNPVAGVKPSVKLIEIDDGGTFGGISAITATDENGQSFFTFSNSGSTGRQAIIVSLPASEGGGNIAAVEEEIEVSLLTSLATKLSLNLSPSTIYTTDQSLTYEAEVLLRAADGDNNPVEGLSVDFVCSYGVIIGDEFTDHGGLAKAKLLLIPAEDWDSDDENATEFSFPVKASLSDGNSSIESTLTLIRPNPLPGSLELTHQVPFIYADHGRTTDTLTAILRDADGAVIPFTYLTFTATHGTVSSPQYTDEFGLARAVFKDNGIPSTDDLGNIIPAVITVKYREMNISNSVECEIREHNPVDIITLIADKNQMQAGSQDSATVKATCFLSNGDHAPNGTFVNFEVDNGRFSQSTVPIEGNFGIARTKYIAGNLKGIATIRAWVNTGEERIYSNEFIVTLSPGNPSRIQVVSNPSTLTTNDPAALSTITATIRDTANNPVDAGHLVTFETTLGSLERTATTTDEHGRAVTYLRPGTDAGVAQITATVTLGVNYEITGVTTVTLMSGGPHSIIIEPDPPIISAANSGGTTSSLLEAKLFDGYGNPVETARTVIFELIDEPAEPEGCNLNNHGQIDSAQTAGGRAHVTLNAGTFTGNKQVHIYTWSDQEREDTVSVTTEIVVTNGPPANIDVSVDTLGIRLGGNLFELEAAALVTDNSGNPVSRSIPVFFTVAPQIASVEAASTGNMSRNGYVRAGTAFAPLIYNADNAGETITITATIGDPRDELTDEIELVLPEN